MRLDINLATRPYEDAREFWTRWGLGVGLLGVLTLVLLVLAVRGWINAGRDRHDIAQLQQQIAERDKERAEGQAFLDMAANRSTRDQSQFLNGLIQRKRSPGRACSKIWSRSCPRTCMWSRCGRN